MKEKKSNQKDINVLVKRDLTNSNEETNSVDIEFYPAIKSSSEGTYQQYNLSSLESVQSMLEQIEEDRIVMENQKPIILKQIEELFWLKENDTPSSVAAKWTEISKFLNTLEMKAKN